MKIALLIVLLACGFWLCWFFRVQLDRLNTASKQEAQFARKWVQESAPQAGWVLRIGGYVMYAPYLWPLRGLALWVVIVTMFATAFVAVHAA